MKQKIIDVKYRKNSESFPQWMKYEITLLNEDNSIEKMPAYGKDLQDALSRVVHDKKVTKVYEKASTLPWWIYATIWFTYVISLSIITNFTEDKFLLIGGIMVPMVSAIILNQWLIERNRDKIERKER